MTDDRDRTPPTDESFGEKLDRIIDATEDYTGESEDDESEAIIDALIDVVSRTADEIREPTDEWVLYIPMEYADAVTAHVDDREPMDVYHNGTTIGGHDWTFDPHIDEPQLLPESIQDLTPETYCLLDPPENLVREWVRLEGTTTQEGTTPLGAEQTTYTIRPFYNIRRRHHTLNDALIRHYDLDIPRLPAKEPDGYHRQKIGHEVTRSEFVPDDVGYDDEVMMRKIVETIIDIANSIDRSPIVGTRERRIEFPYEWLDFTHREEIRCGTTYTYYGGVFLKPVDLRESVQKLRGFGPDETPDIDLGEHSLEAEDA